MDLAVSKALNIYAIEMKSMEANSYFVSLPLSAPDFMQSYEYCLMLRDKLSNLKNNKL